MPITKSYPQRLLLSVLASLAVLLLGLDRGSAQERVEFPSLDGKTTLVGYLLRAEQPGPHPAIVMLHGCSGLGQDGRIFATYRDWSRVLAKHGYSVLMVDSAASRGVGQTCTAGSARRTMWADRPKDAYGALAYLQSQTFANPERVALMGWSQGGGVVLLSVPRQSSGRPDPAPMHDFRAAVALYPGACSDHLQSQPFVAAVAPHSWTTQIPLLVLQGEADDWTLAGPCREFLDEAKARGAKVALQLYPDASHAFDAPGMPVHERLDYRMENGVVPVMGTNPEARADAFLRVQSFLRDELGE